jgi:transposase
MTSMGAEKMTDSTLGIDISKEWLETHRWPDGDSRRFANTKKGHQALIRWIGRGPVARVVFEATGAYHRDLERALGAAGLPAARVNPRQARRFAEAAGKLAKTDRIDAAMLARMGALLEPDVRAPATPALDELRDLRLARAALIKHRTATTNRAKHLRLALLRSQSARRLKQIDRDIAAIDDAIATVIAADEALARACAILCSIPGLSGVTAAAILAEMPELGSLEPAAAASLAGLAPVTRQSGTWQGRATIRGGRRGLRRALYMPTLAATRCNPDFKARYDAFRRAGKPPKVAITALMRKLLLLANALLRDGRTWTPEAP